MTEVAPLPARQCYAVSYYARAQGAIGAFEPAHVQALAANPDEALREAMRLMNARGLETQFPIRVELQVLRPAEDPIAGEHGERP